MTIDATMAPNRRAHAFHFWLRTMTKDAIAETTMVRIVALTVMIAEFIKTSQKFIFFMACGKFLSVNPCSPTSESGFDVISPLVLNTLITTRIKGATKQINRINSTIHIMTCMIFFFLAAFSFCVMLPPPLSYQCRPG